MRVILASKSPRRKELLREVFEEFEIIVADCDESLFGLEPEEGVAEIARRKGAAVLDMLKNDRAALDRLGVHDVSELLILSSDTLVECDGIPLGKPRDDADAVRMLTMLSGRGHNVHTGVAIHYGGRCVFDTDTSEVVFKELSPDEIEAYVATGEPSDKAGSYGIQGKGGALVQCFVGRKDTIVGLSVALVEKLYSKIIKEEIQ